MNKRLYRNEKDKVIAGVASGLADYFKIDVTIIRVIMAVVALSAIQFFIVGYILAALIIPVKPADYMENETEDDVEVMDRQGEVVKRIQNNRQFLGAAFVIIGGMLILTRTVSWFDTGIMTAVAIIALGGYILIRGKDSESK